jgi:TonB family protein
MSPIRLLIPLALATVLSAAEFSGAWCGSAKGGAETKQVCLNLIQWPEKLSGMVRIGDDNIPAEAKGVQVHGDTLQFEVQYTKAQVAKFTLTSTNGTLDGEVAIGGQSSKVTLTRVSTGLNPATLGVRDKPTGSYPILLHSSPPEYSAEARAAKLQGTVVLRVKVGADGMVSAESIQVVKGLGIGLDEKAVEAVKTWKFQPAVDRAGMPIAAPATLEVAFHLL